MNLIQSAFSPLSLDMVADKDYCFNVAVELTKEYYKAGGEREPQAVLDELYETLVRLQTEVEY